MTVTAKALHGDGHNPNAFGIPGIEKSSISSFRMMPVSGSITREPNTRLIVDVIDTAMPFESTTDVWLFSLCGDKFKIH